MTKNILLAEERCVYNVSKKPSKSDKLFLLEEIIPISEKTKETDMVIKPEGDESTEPEEENYKKIHQTKSFGFIEVSWAIQNSCVVPCNSDKIFYSPDFYVNAIYSTKWRMILTRLYTTNRTYDVKFRLERLPFEPYIGVAIVDCYLKYNDGEETMEMEFKSTIGGNMYDQDKSLIYAGVIPTDGEHKNVFKMKLQMLVRFSGIASKFPLCSNKGISGLSEDLLWLFEVDREMADFTFEFEQIQQLVIHKVILRRRIKDASCKNSIDQGSRRSLFEDFQFEPSKKVIQFIYTGDLNYAIEVPSICLFRFAEVLGVKEIVYYYNPDEAFLTSEIEQEEYFIEWTIENFCNIRDYFLESPVMVNRKMDAKWHILFYPRGSSHSGVAQIKIVYETSTSKDVCANLFFGKSEVCISHRFHTIIRPGEVLDEIDLVDRHTIINNYVNDDNLVICLRLRMSTGKEKSSAGYSISGYKHLTERKIYDDYSKDITSIYDHGTFYDVVICIEDIDIAIGVHEYILRARCPSLYHAIHLESDLRYFNDFNLAVILIFFQFIYSGRLRSDLSLTETSSTYKIANHFNFESLKQVLEDKLIEEFLSEHTADRLYIFALGQGIRNLESAAKRIIELRVI